MKHKVDVELSGVVEIELPDNVTEEQIESMSPKEYEALVVDYLDWKNIVDDLEAEVSAAW